MQITFKKHSDKSDYESVLVINAGSRWKETMYLTFYTPHGEEDEKLYVGRYMSDVHFRRKPCEAVWVFDFHRWDSKTIEQAMELELLPVSFGKPVKELLESALQERENSPDGFDLKVKDTAK